MNEYQKRVLEGRKQIIELNLEQQKELQKIYEDLSNKLIPEILEMKDCRSKTHQIEIYKAVSRYKTELYYKLNESITDNINKAADIEKGVQLSFVDMIAPNVEVRDSIKKTITEVSSNTVKQLIAGNYYKDGKTLDKRIWNLVGNNAEKIDEIIKMNIAKGANAKELAKELDKYVNPKARTQSKSYKSGINNGKISYQAERLARTSITHAQTEVLIQNSIKNPFCIGLKWHLSASHSERMHGKTDVCDEYDGKIFKPEETPLQHPNCLCYLEQIVENENKAYTKLKDWVENGGSPKIDEWVQNKKYHDIEVYGTYDKEGNVSIKVRETKDNKKKINKPNKYQYNNVTQSNNENAKDIVKIIKDIKSESDSLADKFKIPIRKFVSDDIVVIDNALKIPMKYSPEDDIIKVNIEDEYFKYYPLKLSVIHEFAHRMDILEVNSCNNNDFKKAIDDTIIILKEDLLKEYFDEEDGEFFENMCLSDIMSALTNNKVHGEFLHHNNYWSKQGNREREIFANIFAELSFGSDKEKQFLKEQLPIIYKEFIRMLGDKYGE